MHKANSKAVTDLSTILKKYFKNFSLLTMILQKYLINKLVNKEGLCLDMHLEANNINLEIHL